MDAKEAAPFDIRNGPDDDFLPPVRGGSSSDTTVSAASLPAVFAYPRGAYAAVRENVLGRVVVVAARSLASAQRPAPGATSDSGLEHRGSSPSSPRPGAPVRAAGALRARPSSSKRTLAPTGRNGHARPAASGSSGNASFWAWIALTRRALVALACMAPRRGPVDTGVDAGRTALKRAEPGRPGRVRVRPLAARAAGVLLAAVAALLALPLQAQAQTEVPDDWALIPSGLAAGDSFRLLFLSSTKRDGSSSNIGDYNGNVQWRASVGHAAIQEHSSQFKAVGCTTAVDARDNTGTTGTGVPIYWLNGNKVADDNADFYDGNWDDEANDKNEFGNNGPNTSNTANYPLTGCDDDGTQDFRALGTVTSIRVGRPNTSGSGNGPLYGSSDTVTTSQNRPMYGLSAVFTVGASASTDATLSGLALENADDGSTIALNQTFATARKSYTASVATGVDEITVLPETTDDGATVEYLDGSDVTIVDSHTFKDDQQVALNVGANTIKVKVTAEDDATTDTYTVVVTRASDTTAPSPESAAVAQSGASVTVTFNEGLDVAAEFLPAAVVNAFTVTADGVDLDIDRVALAASNALNIRLPTGTTISENQTVKLSYDKTVAGADALEDANGNEVASFTDFAVTNNSTVAPNNPPVFPSSTAARNVAENSPAGTDVGNAVTATDDDNDTLTYTLEGTDVASFDLVRISGSAQIRTKSGVTYDHETKSSYAVTVMADDSNGGTDTIAVTITVTDVDEPPARPVAPSVSSVANSTTSLSVTWTAPSTTGRPAIANYDLRYRQGTSGGWTDGPQNVSGTSATISGLSANTLYQVQVLATNSEGDSPWSVSGSGQTNTVGNTAPTFPSSTATRNVAENSPAGTDVGNAVTATDDDNDPLTYTLEGTDAASFALVTTAGSGQIRTRSGVTYDREAQPSYMVIVKADDGNGGTDTVMVTITVTDVSEPPGRPAAPSVSSVAGSTTSLSVMWTAPENTGPAIDTYDLRYRQGISGSWTNVPQNVSGTSATISGLTANTLYQVQVLATNAEGDSPWSLPGSGQTNTAGNTAPTFSSSTASRSVAENSAAGTNVGAVLTATDADNDTLTYTLDGTDAASFALVTTAGSARIRTKSGVTYDYETQSSYVVIVKADDGNGGSDTIMVTITVTDVDEPPSPGPEPVPTPALPLLGHLLLALGLTAAGARVIRRHPRVPPAA